MYNYSPKKIPNLKTKKMALQRWWPGFADNRIPGNLPNPSEKANLHLLWQKTKILLVRRKSELASFQQKMWPIFCDCRTTKSSIGWASFGTKDLANQHIHLEKKRINLLTFTPWLNFIHFISSGKAGLQSNKLKKHTKLFPGIIIPSTRLQVTKSK